MNSCRQLGMHPGQLGAINFIGKQPSVVRGEHRATFAGLRRHARKNGLNAFELATWIMGQDMTWLQAVKSVQYVLDCDRARAKILLLNAGWTPSPATQDVNKGLPIERR